MTAIVPTHARQGCCAYCNFTDLVVAEYDHLTQTFTGRNICVDEQECVSRVAYNHDSAVRYETLTELNCLCDAHLLSCWGFQRVRGEVWSQVCPLCEEERFASVD